MVNRDTGDLSASDSQAVVGDGSGGSDTDISRPSSVDQTKRPEGHMRTNSALKKPTSFKSVSVTKNFLAKSAVTVPVARPGDKNATPAQPSASALQTAKPRLVAKSGGSNVPRSLGKLNGASSGPDASKVWNKNQPVPPPPPKQFTDEELKQQYGIHLATRLQADDGGKEAKWADIDDDEDDWTPDTVQWMDGTKSTVAAVENQPPPPEEPAAAPAPRVDTPTILAKPTPPAATAPAASPAAAPASTTPKTSVTGGTKTILKPGAHAQSSSSKLKGQQDKPTLVAKPLFAPVKSPWASLPPVEKVSPVAINPPVQQQPQSRYSRDSHGFDAMPPPAAKEIAPDDFNRSWRDERGNRELFNSHNGRYEPVGEMRRGSIRDNGHRQQPALLQRPSHDGPAEPSAAFQTSRTSGDVPTWGRRRNSSNVSGESGRRMSFDRRGPDLPPMGMPTNTQRRESISINGVDAGASATARHPLPAKPLSIDHPSTLSAKASPSVAHAQPASPFGSAASLDVTTPSAPPPIQDLVEVQQRVMHGSLESVKQRKLREKEEEAKKEAEKKERLRQKLEALTPKTEDAKPKPKAELPAPLPQNSPQKEKAVPVPAHSPPKPPVPTSKGEVAQYGMMKVHQPHTLKKSSPTDVVQPKAAGAKRSPSPRKALPGTQSQAAGSPSPAQTTASLIQDKTSAQLQSQQSQQSPAATQNPRAPETQAAKSSQPPQAPWSGSQPRTAVWTAPSTSNVWAPPSATNRALGNGTFSQTAPAPVPIGTNPALSASTSQSPAPPNQSVIQPAMYTQTAAPPSQMPGAPRSGSIAPPAARGGWGDFHAQIRRNDKETLAKAQESFERLGGASFRPELHETYIDTRGKPQTTVHSKVAPVESKAPQHVAAAEAKPKEDTVKGAHEGPSPPQSLGQAAPVQSNAQGARSSRFFPRHSEATTQASSPSSKDDAPPPPETEAHPAFSGDTSHPVVKMPRPPARVRLPPTAVEAAAEAAASAETPVSMPSRSRLGIGARPLALTQEWQARFNSLLEKPSASGVAPISITRPSPPAQTASSPKTGSLAIAPSSKAPLEVRSNPAPATVSLPATRKASANDGNTAATTRVNADYLLEDREFGSLPTVRLSKVPHLAANQPQAAFPPTPRQNSKYNRFRLDVQSAVPYEGKGAYRQTDTQQDTVTYSIPVKLGNMRSGVTKPLVVKNRNDRRGPNQGHARPKRSFNTNGPSDSPTSGQNQRTRKPSNYQGQGPAPNSSNRASVNNAWTTNHTPSNSNPWNRRPASTATPVN
jgi:hypothetical protein